MLPQVAPLVVIVFSNIHYPPATHLALAVLEAYGCMDASLTLSRTLDLDCLRGWRVGVWGALHSNRPSSLSLHPKPFANTDPATATRIRGPPPDPCCTLHQTLKDVSDFARRLHRHPRHVFLRG